MTLDLHIRFNFGYSDAHTFLTVKTEAGGNVAESQVSVSSLIDWTG